VSPLRNPDNKPQSYYSPCLRVQSHNPQRYSTKCSLKIDLKAGFYGNVWRGVGSRVEIVGNVNDISNKLDLSAHKIYLLRCWCVAIRNLAVAPRDIGEVPTDVKYARLVSVVHRFGKRFSRYLSMQYVILHAASFVPHHSLSVPHVLWWMCRVTLFLPAAALPC
jgi:hypothetical protein